MARDHRKGKQERQQEVGLQVFVYNNDIERALRKFKRKVNNSGILQEYRAKQEFVPKTERRLRAEAAAKARHRKRIAMDPFYEPTGPRRGKKK